MYQCNKFVHRHTFIFWTKCVHEVYYLCKCWTNGKQSRMTLDLTCWVFNCRFPQSRNFVIGQMLVLPISTQEMEQVACHLFKWLAMHLSKRIYFVSFLTCWSIALLPSWLFVVNCCPISIKVQCVIITIVHHLISQLPTLAGMRRLQRLRLKVHEWGPQEH